MARTLTTETIKETPTYQGLTWADRIAVAQETGSFTKEDTKLCAFWATCAVGEQFLDYTYQSYQDTNGQMVVARALREAFPDRQYADLGIIFMGQVQQNNIEGAALALKRITSLAKEARGL